MAKPDKEKLTPKQREFIRQYILLRNGVLAARKAGYKGSDDTLGQVASENLRKPHIAREIEANDAKIQEEFEVTQERIIGELADMAFGHIGDVLDWDEKGEISLKPKESMSKRGIKYIDSIKVERGVSTKEDSEGVKTVELYVKDIKVSTLGKEKVKALELLGKHTGLWKDGRTGSDTDSRKAVLDRLQNYFSKNRKDRSGGST